MRPKMYPVYLTQPNREQLTRWSKSQRHSERERLPARILLYSGPLCQDSE